MSEFGRLQKLYVYKKKKTQHALKSDRIISLMICVFKPVQGSFCYVAVAKKTFVRKVVEEVALWHTATSVNLNGTGYRSYYSTPFFALCTDINIMQEANTILNIGFCSLSVTHCYCTPYTAFNFKCTSSDQ